MKKHIYLILLFVLSLNLGTTSSWAQQVNTLYFMDNVPYRNVYNPAFQPLSNFYMDFPMLGFTHLSVGNNSLALKDVIYKDPTDPNALPILFLNPNGSLVDFMGVLRTNTLLNADVSLDLLSFGFRVKRAYWNFSLSQRVDARITIPKDFMSLLFNGLYDANNLTHLGSDVNIYSEAGLGYSLLLNEQWSFGTKFKFLYGIANANISNDYLNFKTSTDSLTVRGNGHAYVSSPVALVGLQLPSTMPSVQQMLKPSGLGAGIDLGVTYKPIKQLQLSAALVDLGFLHWTQNAKKISYQVDYTFTGVKTGGSINMDTIINNQLEEFKNAIDTVSTQEAYNTYTNAKLNIGAEYGFFKNTLTVGLLSRTMFHRKKMYEELTTSLNYKPIDWFNITTSYSFMNGRMSNIGGGLGLRTGFMHWFLAADYIPLSYAKTAIMLGTDNLKVPYNTKGLNMVFGVNFVFGNKKDADKDGVVDRKDICPATPVNVLVDKKGCPIDTDADGVPDYLDKCPNTPKAAFGLIDANGCPIDTDKDEVPDYLDKCNDTPVASRFLVDSVGCSLDSDKDGIADYLDKCPQTPVNVKVDSLGCPLDTDGDGVVDYLDKCPNTPIEARGKIDMNGCPLDTDLDSVPDYKDLCPNTPAIDRKNVDINGCSKDTDGDGVVDYLDKCPNTPKEAKGLVDSIGCPIDSDADSIPDYLDNCPKLAGTVANKGCPEVKKEIKTLFQKALQGIQFQTGKSVILPSSFPLLNQIADVLIQNPNYQIEIGGHTDNVGNPVSNITLSGNRAAAVKKYLTQRGVDEKRITSKGYGDTKPVASNKTTTGKAKNRRVEFVVSFEESRFE